MPTDRQMEDFMPGSMGVHTGSLYKEMGYQTRGQPNTAAARARSAYTPARHPRTCHAFPREERRRGTLVGNGSGFGDGSVFGDGSGAEPLACRPVEDIC